MLGVVSVIWELTTPEPLAICPIKFFWAFIEAVATPELPVTKYPQTLDIVQATGALQTIKLCENDAELANPSGS